MTIWEPEPDLGCLDPYVKAELEDFDSAHPDFANANYVVADPAPSEALAAGLEPDTLSFSNTVLYGLNEEVSALHDRGRQLQALTRALDQACSWAFVIPSQRKFDARIGLLPVNLWGTQHVAIFFSFQAVMPTNPTVYHGNTDATGSGPSTINPALLSQLGPVAAVQPRNEIEVTGLSLATKRWVAERILRMLLRIYGGVAFPNRLWLMEDLGGDKAPFLLVLYTMGVYSDGPLGRRAYKAVRRIIEQINQLTGLDDLPEGEEQDGFLEERQEEEAGTDLDSEEMGMTDEDEDVDMTEDEQ
ncbi:hypothetical protein F5Y10DRAFT_262486 [Nemania abortiva]|nr:hypothetical protein F5Y10DRAFT_262486 [Nemania abortiva]